MTDRNEASSEARFLVLDLCRAVARGEPWEPSVPGPDVLALAMLEATKQKVLALLCARSLKGPIASALQSQNMLSVWWDIYQASRLRTAAQLACFMQVREALAAKSIPCAGRKGVAYDTLYYAQRGERRSNDIDILIRADDIQGYYETMHELGFVIGNTDFSTGEIKPIPRREEVFYTMYPDHAKPLMRRGTADFPRHLRIDAATQLGWHKSSFDEHLKQLTFALLPRDAGAPAALGGGVHFVDCSLHIYRELFMPERGDSDTGSVTLQKLLDISVIAASLGEEGVAEARRVTGGDPELCQCVHIVGAICDAVLETGSARSVITSDRDLSPDQQKTLNAASLDALTYDGLAHLLG